MSLYEELLDAVREGDAARVRELLRKGANANAKDRRGWTPLHWAAAGGHAEVARLLLERGADVNARDDDDWTPLHIAAAKGRVEVARLLLERGADPSIRDKDGRTPLDVARGRGHKEVARVIEEYVQRRRGVGVEVPATPAGALAQQPAPAAPSILSVECSGLRAGEWGRLLVRVQGSGTASVSLEGDVDWLDPGRVKLSGESLVEVPVRPRAAGEVPVRVVVRSPSGEDTKITWLKVSDRAGKCPSCGAPAEPGAKYCWRCGAKLV
ncbi:MAG: ankyrin repeat domain-containing protein [Thermofilum sp.]|nr:ankyrin repeat domain-containing protein [Thermofilum sp.]